MSKQINSDENLDSGLQAFNKIEQFFDKKGIDIYEVYRTAEPIENEKKSWVGVTLDKSFFFWTDLSNQVLEYNKIAKTLVKS